MVFTQCNILNRDSRDIDDNSTAFVRAGTERIQEELHLGRGHPVLRFSTNLHYFRLSIKRFENG